MVIQLLAHQVWFADTIQGGFASIPDASEVNIIAKMQAEGQYQAVCNELQTIQ